MKAIKSVASGSASVSGAWIAIELRDNSSGNVTAIKVVQTITLPGEEVANNNVDPGRVETALKGIAGNITSAINNVPGIEAAKPDVDADSNAGEPVVE